MQQKIKRSDPAPPMQVCGVPLEQFLERTRAFHGSPAPGLILGAIMVDWACELIGPGVEFDAIVETFHCLPDAVQLLTPCSTGNGWMKVLDWDKFAVTFFDRHTFEGYRVWLDIEKTKSFKNVYDWYMRLRPKRELPLDVLRDSLTAAGRDMLSCRPVKVTGFHERRKKGPTAVCPSCGEVYPVYQGPVCAACGGDSYYEILSE